MTARAPSVAVIDDTQHVREMLVSMLSLDGFDVVAQGAGADEAISIATDAKPDVMVIDYSMPGQNGLDAARKILESRPEQRVILYTAYLSEDIQKQAEKLGVAACLNKLEGLESLEANIAKICRKLG